MITYLVQPSYILLSASVCLFQSFSVSACVSVLSFIIVFCLSLSVNLSLCQALHQIIFCWPLSLSLICYISCFYLSSAINYS